MTLLVFTPTIGNEMRPETVSSIKAQVTDVPHVWEVGYHNPFPGQKMRNVVAQYQRARDLCLAGDYDAMLTVEHDMVLPPDAIQKLYHTDAPVVYGVYMLRHGAYTLNAWQYINDRNLGMSLSLYPDEVKRYREQGWGRVCGVGWGCTLIRRPVLERLQIHSANEADAGDLTFATECLRAGFVQIARFDVPCDHIDDRSGRILKPFSQGGGAVGRVYVLQSVTANVNGQSVPLKVGRYYTLPPDVAKDLARAGYVRITNGLDADVEMTVMDPVHETAVAPVQKRRGRKGGAA